MQDQDFAGITPVLPACEQARPRCAAAAGRYHRAIVEQPFHTENAPVARLRGAAVEIDRRRVALVLGVVSALALVVAGAVLLAAGIRKNAQIDDLRAHGVPVVVTVTTCTGQVAGSGSNPVGYTCRGTFRFGGRLVEDQLPGTEGHTPGDRLDLVTAADDTGLLATAAQVAHDRASATVFVAPVALLAAGFGLGAAFVVAARRRRRGAAQDGGV